MKILRNEKGLALVMTMILSVICLAIVAVMIFMATQTTRMSGYLREYKTAEEAGLGGTELMAEFLKQNVTEAAKGAPSWITIGLETRLNDNCLKQKLTLAPTGTNWSQCAGGSLANATNVTNIQGFPDLQFSLGNYTVYAKIVDTVIGNSDVGGIVASGELGGGGVVYSETGIKNPQQYPYLYRMEVETVRTTNQQEKSRYSVLYAY